MSFFAVYWGGALLGLFGLYRGPRRPFLAKILIWKFLLDLRVLFTIETSDCGYNEGFSKFLQQMVPEPWISSPFTPFLGQNAYF